MDFGYLGLFLATFLAATVIPFSSEAVLAAMLLSGFNPLACLTVASLGNTLGGLSSYGFGYLGDWSKITKWLGAKPEKVKRWKTQVDRYGSYTAILCWLPFVGDVIAIALGLFKTPFWHVTFFMSLGKTARYAVIMWFFMNW